MSNSITVTVPDIGDFDAVDIIEILVSAGETVEQEASLVTLETDKATMDIPCPQAGTIDKVLVKVGDRVTQGSAILKMTVSDDNVTAETPATKAETPAPPTVGDTDLQAEVVVLGSGPGGYTAAFRAADLGKQVILIERHDNIGGVCLNVGCIPSKALLHTAETINEAAAMSAHGVTFGKPEIDLAKLANWKNNVIARLTGGLTALAKQRKVKIVTGVGSLTSAHTLEIAGKAGTTSIRFDNLIIAAGSRATQIPAFPNDDSRLMDSTDALELDNVPRRLLVVGGGIIGLEMATIYDALGSAVTIVELSPDIIPGCDRDLVRPLEKRIRGKYENIFTGTQVTTIEKTSKNLKVGFSGGKAPEFDSFDRVLIAVGRRPNGLKIGAENAGITVDEHGFIPVNNQQRTNIEHIFAIGDVVGQPMLAHKATHEGKVAAEVIAGMKSHLDARGIPSVAYTDPEIAWMGTTETQARAQGMEYKKGVFPWAASGRALSIGRDEGLTKILFDKASGQIIGAGIVGPNAGELIAEAVLALEMGANAEDMSLTIHPHPTLSETLNFAAEMAEGTITDLYIPRK